MFLAVWRPRFGKAVSARRKPFVCHLCGKSYAWKESLCRHLREECGVPPQFRCANCGKTFKQRCSLQRHLLNIHGTYDAPRR
ncbi:uncharacterized protein LOC143149480 [Ptiloglossa arizonensis]|uniref:uncharacterized protein LOC143149480 n=1 Tax=Ptiloglossa arizonensis TaxID=3350558 RepID=UPI003FA045C7